MNSPVTIAFRRSPASILGVIALFAGATCSTLAHSPPSPRFTIVGSNFHAEPEAYLGSGGFDNRYVDVHLASAFGNLITSASVEAASPFARSSIVIHASNAVDSTPNWVGLSFHVTANAETLSTPPSQAYCFADTGGSHDVSVSFSVDTSGEFEYSYSFNAHRNSAVPPRHQLASAAICQAPGVGTIGIDSTDPLNSGTVSESFNQSGLVHLSAGTIYSFTVSYDAIATSRSDQSAGLSGFKQATLDVEFYIRNPAGPACAGDFDADGTVDFFDYDAFVICFEGGDCPPGTTADFDDDGTVDFFDYDAFVVAFETPC